MNFTKRELALLMVALDNTSAQIGDEAHASGSAEMKKQAEEMDGLWRRFMIAREDLMQCQVSRDRVHSLHQCGTIER